MLKLGFGIRVCLSFLALILAGGIVVLVFLGAYGNLESGIRDILFWVAFIGFLVLIGITTLVSLPPIPEKNKKIQDPDDSIALESDSEF